MAEIEEVISLLEKARENKGGGFEERTYYLIEKAEQELKEYFKNRGVNYGREESTS